jgi:hypothetical protein
MFTGLSIYGLLINYLHGRVLTKFIHKKKISLILEDVLLGWKYFVLLFFLLYKMFLIAHWAIALYLVIVNLIIYYKHKLLTFSIFTILLVGHIIFYLHGYKHLTSLFMVSYSAIYLTISPCLHTVERLQSLLKFK